MYETLQIIGYETLQLMYVRIVYVRNDAHP